MSGGARAVDETIVAVGVGSGAATERLLGVAANEYRVVQVGPQQFQFARTYRPLWALVLGIVLLPVLVGIVFFFVKSTDTWIATVEEDHRHVRVRIRGTVVAPVLVALRESLGAAGAPSPATGAVPAPAPGMVVEQVGVPGGVPSAPVAPPPTVVPAPAPSPASAPMGVPVPPSAAPPMALPGAASVSPPVALPMAVPGAAPNPPAVATDLAPVHAPGPLGTEASAPPSIAGDLPPAQRTPVRPVPVPRVASAPATDGDDLPDAATALRSSLRSHVLVLDSGDEFVVTGRTLVGRDPEAAPGEAAAQLLPVVDADRSISKTHLVVDLGGDGELRVLDRGSTNGTRVERADGRLDDVPPHRSVPVASGDLVRFGQRSMRIEQRGGA